MRLRLRFIQALIERRCTGRMTLLIGGTGKTGRRAAETGVWSVPLR